VDLDVDNRTVRTTALSLLVGSRSDAFCSAGPIECVRVILYHGHYFGN